MGRTYGITIPTTIALTWCSWQWQCSMRSAMSIRPVVALLVSSSSSPTVPHHTPFRGRSDDVSVYGDVVVFYFFWQWFLKLNQNQRPNIYTANCLSISFLYHHLCHWRRMGRRTGHLGYYDRIGPVLQGNGWRWHGPGVSLYGSRLGYHDDVCLHHQYTACLSCLSLRWTGFTAEASSTATGKREWLVLVYCTTIVCSALFRAKYDFTGRTGHNSRNVESTKVHPEPEIVVVTPLCEMMHLTLVDRVKRLARWKRLPEGEAPPVYADSNMGRARQGHVNPSFNTGEFHIQQPSQWI